MPTDINSFFPLFLLTFLAFVTSLNRYKEELHLYNCSSDNYTDGSTYLGNLQVLMASLIDNTANTKLFYFNNTVGNDSDRVYGMAMCYAYDDFGYCQACITQAAKELVQYCPYSKSAVIWYWPCRLRYSNQSFFSVLYPSPKYYHYENDNVTEPVEFSNELDQVINQFIARVITLPQLFGLNQIGSKVVANKTIYAFVQCIPDLKSDECGQCLKIYNEKLIKCCGRKDVTVLSGLSCHIVFALWPFYPSDALVLNPPVLPSTQSPALPPTYVTAPAQPPQIKKIVRGIRREKLSKIVGVSVGAVAAALVLAVGGIWLWRRQSLANTSKTDDEENIGPLEYQSYSSLICYSEFKVFELDTLRLATNNFSDDKKLGEGGFGSVYKGLLINGQEVAVKRLSGSSKQGLSELKNEVDLLAKIKHRNLVKLLSCCIEQKEKILCYEFLPNGSLDNFLFANEAIRREKLNWETRYGIIYGISCGLQYLHEESGFKIIHRDLKASNILLDIDMTPKISDFGLARLFDEDQTHVDTSIVAGTFGYMAPEYVLHGSFSAKSDVYSFGVLLLQIVTGRKISAFVNSVRAFSLISYVWQHVEEGKIDQLKDPVLDNASSEEVMKCIHIGLLCVQDDPTKRPNMAAISGMLHGTNTPSIPALPSSPDTTSSMPSVLFSTSEQSTS
ncbi:cysteine-rich receptor-like protein kinase 25 isoform X2 [Carex rostrata]